MVLRYCLTSEPEIVRDTFGYHNIEDFPPRDAIWPGQPVVIVRNSHAQRREAVLVRWGLVPSWVRDFEKLGMLSTARIETVLEKPSFRGGLRHKRCLIPADGYFVWRGAAGQKQAHLAVVSDRGGDRKVFGIAGIYEQWMGADGSEIDSVAVLTHQARGPVRSFVDRMPVILPSDEFEAWLDCRNYEAKEALSQIMECSIEPTVISKWNG